MSFLSISLLIALCFVFQWTLCNIFLQVYVFLWFYKVIYLVKDIYCQGDSRLIQFSIICSAKIPIYILCQSYSIVKVAITFCDQAPLGLDLSIPCL